MSRGNCTYQLLQAALMQGCIKLVKLIGQNPREPANRQKPPVDIPPALCQNRAMLGEPRDPFSLTRAAPSTGGRARSKFQ